MIKFYKIFINLIEYLSNMKVAVMYSGGKDSTYAIEYCLNKKWEITHLISVKPNRTDCYLYHYATVELTKEMAKTLGINHIYLNCTIANPTKEAKIIEDVVVELHKSSKIDALVLGGVGLQETQLKSLQKALLPHKVEVFATHAGVDEEDILKDMLSRGYKIIISSIASDGLQKWLGKELTMDNFNELRRDSIKFGFDLLGEGGYYDTFVYDAPIFNKKLIIDDFSRIYEGPYNGHVLVNKFKIVVKKDTFA